MVKRWPVPLTMNAREGILRIRCSLLTWFTNEEGRPSAVKEISFSVNFMSGVGELSAVDSSEKAS